MLEAFKSIPEGIKNWREHSDELYQLLAGIAAVLIAVSAGTAKRPSELLSGLARGLGAAPVARWFGEDAPGFLRPMGPEWQAGFLWAALAVVAIMVIVPLCMGWNDDRDSFADRSYPLLGARSACTVWVLLLCAAQQGPLRANLDAWSDAVLGAVPGLLLWLLGGVVVYVAAWRVRLHRVLNFLLKYPVRLVYRTLTCAIYVLVAVFLAGIAVPVSLTSWVLALQSDRHRKVQAELDEWRAEREGVAQGAVVSPIRAA